MSVMNTLASYLEGGVAHGPLMLGYVMTFIARRSTAYQAARALRFRSSNSAYMSLTPAAGTQDKWKIRAGLKRATLGSKQVIIGAGGSSPDLIYFDSSDRVCWDFAGTTRLVSTAVYRDPSAWGTWEFIYDAGNATASLKARVFYNGVEITTWTTDTRSSISAGTSKINTNVVHNIGRDPAATTSYLGGYLSDCALVDNSATSGFSGATEATTAAWNPKAPSGTKWWLKMSDSSTTSTLGNDSGSDAATWTTSGFSVTAGVTNDSLTDTPTNYGSDTGAGGEVTGNYCTWDPLEPGSGSFCQNGNIDFNHTAASYVGGRSTVAVPDTGTYYIEGTVGSLTSASSAVGFGLAAASVSLSADVSVAANVWCAYASAGGSSTSAYVSANGAKVITSFAAFAAGTVLQLFLDPANNRAWIGRNNVWWDGSGGTTGNPSAGTNPTFTSLPAGLLIWTECYANSLSLNCGQRPYVYTAPTGGKALCTQNLTNTTITTSGSFTGNAAADGPLVFLNGTPLAMTINGNAVTFGTNADKLANGFKVRSSATTYNASGSNTYSVTSTGSAFKYARAQ